MKGTSSRAFVVAMACIVLSASAGAVTNSLIQQPESDSIQVQAVFSSTRKSLSGMQIRISNVSSVGATIHWDACSLVLPDGRSERIIHTPVRYDVAGGAQLETTIPPGVSIRESIWPGNMTHFAFESGRLEYTQIATPRSGGTLGLLLTWSDADGNHQGLWVWQVQRETTSYTWLYVLGILLAFGAVIVVTGP